MKPHLLFITIALGALLATTTTSCGSSKSASKKKLPVAEVAQSAPSVTPAAAYLTAVNLAKSWETVEIPVKVSITKPADFGCSARLQMIRDRWLGISVRMLGFEVAYLTADNDSVHAYVKMKKQYVSESLSSVFAASGFTLSNLQDILIGRIFVPGGFTATAADLGRFDLQVNDGALMAIPNQQPSGAEVGFAADALTGAILSAVFQAGSHQAVITYGPSKETDGGALPASTMLEATLAGGIVAAFDWDVRGARWNRSMAPRVWRKPSGARRIKVNAELLKKLSLK